MQMPSATRPHRPARWFALACETGSMGSRWTLVRWLYREIRAVPASTTYLMPGTVRDVSATLVASTTLRPLCWPKTRCCSAAESRANSGRISVWGRPIEPSASAVSRISRSPERNTRMSPSRFSVQSSSTASHTPVTWSRSSAPSSGSASGR